MLGSRLGKRPGCWDTFFVPSWAERRLDRSQLCPCWRTQAFEYLKPLRARFRRRVAWYAQNNGEHWTNHTDSGTRPGRDAVHRHAADKASNPKHNHKDEAKINAEPKGAYDAIEDDTAGAPLPGTALSVLEERFPQLSRASLAAFAYLVALCIRLSTAAVLVAMIIGSWLGYVTINRRLRSLASELGRAQLQRSVEFGRLRRFAMPLGIVISHVEIRPDGTKPSGVLGNIQLRLAIEPRRWLTQRPGRFRLDVHVGKAIGRAHQRAPGDWDLGLAATAHATTIISSDGSSSESNNISNHRDMPVKSQRDADRAAEMTPSHAALPREPNEDAAPLTLRMLHIDRSKLLLQTVGAGDFAYGRGLYVLGNVRGRLRFAKETKTLSGPLYFQTEQRGSGSCELNLNLLSGVNQVAIQAKAVPANLVSALINLPFESDAGKVHGAVSLVLRPDAKSPEMTGSGRIQGVTLRLAPDAPRFTDVSGRLRFDDSVVIFEGPTGFFGQLPITIAGTIDLTKDYNLIGFVRRVAIKDMLQTFRMDAALPLHGSIKAEVRMHGPLERPLLTGTVTSVGPTCRVDRIPIQQARANFHFDASAMQLQITSLEAGLEDGGQLSGQGTLHLATAKGPAAGLPSRPAVERMTESSASDERQASETEPSIDVSLNVRGAYAGPLLAHYLPRTEVPEIPVDPVGRLSVKLHLSGPLTQARLVLQWRLVGTSPLVVSSRAETVSAERLRPNAELHGAACGSIQMSLADSNEAQHLRVTLDAHGLDMRRFFWRPEWSSTPKALLDTRLFADVTLQRPLNADANTGETVAIASTNPNDLPGTEAQSPVQLDVALDLRRFQLNEFGYTRRMYGDLRFHPRDGLRFHAVPYDQRDQLRLGERSQRDSSALENLKLEHMARFSSDPSFRRRLDVLLQHGAFRLEASLNQGNRFEARLENMPIEQLLGHEFGVGGTVQASASIDLNQERGTGSFALRDAYFRHFRCRQFTGEMFWLDKTVFLQNSVLQQERSEYHIEGMYTDSHSSLDDHPTIRPSWQTKIVVPKGDIAELACLAQAFDGPFDPTTLSVWEIPSHLSLQDQILWFAEYWSSSADVDPEVAIGRSQHRQATRPTTAASVDPKASRSPSGAQAGSTKRPGPGQKNAEQPPSLADLRGAYQGTVTLSSGSERLSFELTGDKWALGPHELGTMCARGTMRRGIINLEQLSFQAPTTGTMVHLAGTAEPAGTVRATVQVAKMPLHILTAYGWAPFPVTGALNASAELLGTVQQPTLRMKGQWQGASLNGLQLRDTQLELVCEAGRCRVCAAAAVPVQQRSWGPARPRWRFWKRPNTSAAQPRWLDSEEESETAKQVPAKEHATGTTSTPKAFSTTMPLSGIRLDGSIPFHLSRILEHLLDTSRPWNERLEQWSPEELFLERNPSESMHIDVQVKRSGVALAAAFLPQLPVAGGSADLRIRLKGTPLHPQVTARCSLSDVRISPPDLETPIESIYGEAELRDWTLHVHSMTGLVQGRVWSLKGTLPVWTSLSTGPADPSESESSREHEPLTLRIDHLPVRLRDRYHGQATGQVLIHGCALQPIVRGSLTLHDGSIMLLPGPGNRNNQRPAAPSLRPENELDIRDYESDGQFVNPFLDLVEQGFPDVVFEQFQLRLGSRTKVVFPLVLNLHLQGEVALNGALSDLRPNGSFRILDGSLNLLTIRLYLNRSEANTVSFSPDAERGAPLDPILHVSLSDRRKYTVRLRNLRASKWESGLEVLDAQGTALERSQLVSMLNERLGNVSANLKLRRGGSLALRSFLNAYTVGGSLGRGNTLWRLSPNLTTSGDGSSLADAGFLPEQLGVYGELESGRFVLSFSRDLQGVGITSISYRPWERIKMEYEKRETGEQNLKVKVYFREAGED
jgi:hypothetical protein